MIFNIRLKLISFTFCVVLLVGGSISLYSIYQGRQRILTTFEKEARETTAMISRSVSNEVYFLDLSSLRLRLQETRINPDISHAYVADLQGVVLVDSTEENALRDQKLTDAFSKEMLLSDHWISRTDEGILKVGGPILMADGSRIGYLHVGFALAKAYQIVRDTTRTSLYITVICLAIGAILAVILSTSFTRPILSIVQASRQIGAGHLDIRLPSKRGDELGTLAESINQMAVNLKVTMERLEKQAEELERTSKVKDEFLSVMSHELRTPLNVVMGYSGMIKDKMLGEINPEQERALDKVINRSGDLLRMITEILQATSLEAHAVKMEAQEVSLGSFLDDLRSNYEVPLDKELALNWDYPPELPTMRTDGEKLKHILQNLINNAVKFTDRGNVTISARYNPKAKAVEFQVADTGIGIQKEMLPVIFERFRQADSSETRNHGGVGIGLYIVRKLTDLLGGTIEAASEPGKGSIFTVTIPC